MDLLCSFVVNLTKLLNEQSSCGDLGYIDTTMITVRQPEKLKLYSDSDSELRKKSHKSSVKRIELILRKTESTCKFKVYFPSQNLKA